MRNRHVSELHHLGDEPRYQLAEAARIVRLRPQTLKRWTYGYRYARGEQPSVIRAASADGALSFFDVLEASFLRTYREKGISLQSIRRALDFTAESLNVERPLLYAGFLHDGKDLFARFQSETGESGLMNVSRKGQVTWPEVVERYLEELDYKDDIAVRWWPEGRDHRVIIDPRFAFGMPIVTSKKVRTDILAERWEAGEKIIEIAGDFGISSDEVEDALRYEQINYASAA